MKKPSKEQTIALHSMMIKQTGGIDGIRDEGLLDMALNSPYQTFDGNELYPSLQGKAARLCYNLISNHPFIDGNKRIGVLVMLVFLDINQIIINCSNEEIIDLGLGIASGKYDSSYIMEWIINYSTN